jgi:hypothetical protein
MKYNSKPYSRKIDKAWGYELLYAPPDFPVVAKVLHGKGGNKISFQYHDRKDEILCLVSGELLSPTMTKNCKSLKTNSTASASR